jgi:hypothetical protein
MFNDAIFTKKMPPSIDDVKVYFSQKGMPEKEAEHFFLLNERRQWTSRKGTDIKNWKAIAYKWVMAVWKANPLLFDKRTR